MNLYELTEEETRALYYQSNKFFFSRRHFYRVKFGIQINFFNFELLLHLFKKYLYGTLMIFSKP